MRPSKSDKSKYVGLEIECFGPLTRSELITRLGQEESLQGKFEIGTDRTITPTEVDPITTEEEPPEGALDIRPSAHATRQLDLAEMVYRSGSWEVNRIITYRSRSRRQERLDNEMYWSNQDHEVEETAQPVVQHTYEVRVLVKQSEMTSVTRKVYRILNEVGCSTNESCGLHVHLDMRHRNPMTAYYNLFRCQDLLFNLQPEERLDSEYCGRNYESTLINHVEAEDDKYFAINPFSYDSLRTIEVRVAQGTMISDKVVSWLDLLTTIVDLSTEMERSYSTMSTFTDDYTLSREDSADTLEEMEEAA